MSIVFDASVKASEGSPSLNDCLKTGPPLQNVLLSVLVRNRLKQVVWEADRGALWFHWIKDKYSSQTDIEIHEGFARTFAVAVSSCRDLETTFRNFKNWIPKACGGNHDDTIVGEDTVDQVYELKWAAI